MYTLPSDIKVLWAFVNGLKQNKSILLDNHTATEDDQICELVCVTPSINCSSTYGFCTHLGISKYTVSLDDTGISSKDTYTNRRCGKGTSFTFIFI